MPGIIEGYKYDIFISYRQKDNKGDRWVSKFVDTLKTELESTFKEEISVYFDINPHDGLLDTHDVDESLKEKLKCLIFIPVISRTYCDPKAFAWEHEFKTFVKQASEDELGLKIKLPNGNVASRVLPIIIYDLDRQDIQLCESVLDGTLRGIEFIYKSSGVNRPLLSNEDHPHDNTNRTYYRDQVNKVANTIKDILHSLPKSKSPEEIITGPAIADKKISTKRPVKKKPHKIPSASFIYKLKKLTAFSQGTWRVIMLVLVIISIGCVYYGLKHAVPPAERPVLRYNIPIDNYPEIGTQAMALSQDGKKLVYVMNNELNVLQLNSDAPSVSIPGTIGAMEPYFSQDDQWIVYGSRLEAKLMKVPLNGGSPVTLYEPGSDLSAFTWHENEIIFAAGGVIYRISDSGGTPERLYPLGKSENSPRIQNLQLLPDKKTLLFSQQMEDGRWSIMTWRLGSKESPVVLVESGLGGRFLNSGHIAYTLDGHLYIRRLNPGKNPIVSEPQIIRTNDIFEYPIFGASQFDFSDNGILVYFEEQDILRRNLVWVDDSGRITPVTRDAKTYGFMAVSDDAENIAVSVLSDEPTGFSSQIEIINTKSGNSQLFAEIGYSLVWSADNASVIYSIGNQILQKPLDLSTPPELLFKRNSTIIYLSNLSNDGRYLSFWTSNGIGYYDMMHNTVEMLEHYNKAGGGSRPVISPDGEWIAYVSDYNRQQAIYVAPFPGPGKSTRVTSYRRVNDISIPKWAPDMSALYYRTTRPDYEIWKVKVKFSDGNFTFEPAQLFFNGGNAFVPAMDIIVHPDGDRILVPRRETAEKQKIQDIHFKVIANWDQELEEN